MKFKLHTKPLRLKHKIEKGEKFKVIGINKYDEMLALHEKQDKAIADYHWNKFLNTLKNDEEDKTCLAN